VVQAPGWNDLDVVNDLINQTLTDPLGDGSTTYMNSDGTHDIDSLKKAAVQLAVDNAVTNAWSEKPASVTASFLAASFTADTWYAGILPTGPGALNPIGLDPDELAASNHLRGECWKLFGPGRTGHVQTEVRQHGMVVVESNSGRTIGKNATPRRALTTNNWLIRELLVVGKLVRSADRNSDAIEKFLEEIFGRQPGLAVPIAKMVRGDLKASHARIKHADPAWVEQHYGPSSLGLDGAEVVELTEADEVEDEVIDG
jgi:hypothetical protein